MMMRSQRAKIQENSWQPYNKVRSITKGQFMSVVIIGGHDRMVCQYKKICKEHKCIYPDACKVEQPDWVTGSDYPVYKYSFP